MSKKTTTAKKSAVKKVATKKPAAKKQPAKKSAAPKPKTPAKKAATKKPVAKKAAKKQASTSEKSTTPAPSPEVSTKQETPHVAPANPPSTQSAPRSDKPLEATRKTQNGVTEPKPASVAGRLWKIIDGLHESLGRFPARFEYLKAVHDANAANPEGRQFKISSSSFQYFKYRVFHGIKGRSVGIYPKRNSFEMSVPVKRVPRQKKTNDKQTPELPTPPPAPEAPAAPPVSSRLAEVSAKAE